MVEFGRLESFKSSWRRSTQGLNDTQVVFGVSLRSEDVFVRGATPRTNSGLVPLTDATSPGSAISAELHRSRLLGRDGLGFSDQPGT